MPDDSGAVLELALGHERLRLEAWGEDSVRVRVGQGQIVDDVPGALVANAPACGRQQRGNPCQWEDHGARHP